MSILGYQVICAAVFDGISSILQYLVPLVLLYFKQVAMVLVNTCLTACWCNTRIINIKGFKLESLLILLSKVRKSVASESR